ncbi:MAG: tripartite tricarboxylate transporter substrate binding protein [Betaproteobacteria bacterium]|nr:tripartite tricarboxylate transporter substrate binding protein [Betaproteobacteria bacterium]
MKNHNKGLVGRRQIVLGAASLPLFTLPATSVFAQNYPSKTIRLICPFPPGGAVDIACRALAAELSKQLGQTVAVENRPGAGGNVGLVEAVKSAADGYTLYMSTSGIQAINPVLYSKMPADPNKDLAPVSALVSLNNVLVLHPSVKANNVKDLIAYAKANPGKLSYASSGNGTSIHMSGEMFKALAGVDMVHVPYKGGGPALNDVIGGQVPLFFGNLASTLQHVQSGRLRALAVTSAKRSPILAGVPTLSEAGVKGAEIYEWNAVFVPAGTSQAVVSKVASAFQHALDAPEVKQRIAQLGGEIQRTTPELAQAFIE